MLRDEAAFMATLVSGPHTVLLSTNFLIVFWPIVVLGVCGGDSAEGVGHRLLQAPTAFSSTAKLCAAARGTRGPALFIFC